MDIQISDGKTISEIQKAFNTTYRYLKLEFYSKPHTEHQGSPKEYLLSPNLTIGQARTKHNSGDLHLHGNLHVSTLENNFRDIYGLNVQVFRKSGDLWLQTITSDDLSLAEQNSKGKEMDQPVV